jgi:hypothetical protein
MKSFVTKLSQYLVKVDRLETKFIHSLALMNFNDFFCCFLFSISYVALNLYHYEVPTQDKNLKELNGEYFNSYSFVF